MTDYDMFATSCVDGQCEHCLAADNMVECRVNELLRLVELDNVGTFAADTVPPTDDSNDGVLPIEALENLSVVMAESVLQPRYAYIALIYMSPMLVIYPYWCHNGFYYYYTDYTYRYYYTPVGCMVVTDEQ